METQQEAIKAMNKMLNRLPTTSPFPELLTWYEYRINRGLSNIELLTQVYTGQVKAYTFGNLVYFKKSDLMQELKEWDLKALEQSKSKI